MDPCDILFKVTAPAPGLSDYVANFWMLTNLSDAAHDVVVLPDERFDVLFIYSAGVPYHVTFRGLDTEPKQTSIPAKTVMFAVSLKLLAIEYLLRIKAAPVLNEGSRLPAHFWNLTEDDLSNFERCCEIVSAAILPLIPAETDSRKKALFDLLYTSDGDMTVAELSRSVFWSSRQISRYFHEYIGISLKAYCSILRFKASLRHIKDGRLYPEQNFTDQNHFIKEIKRLSGVVPKELAKNHNDRFILLSAMP